MKNEITHDGSTAIIHIYSKKFGHKEVLIDSKDVKLIDDLKWRIVKKTGNFFYCIAHTPMKFCKRETIQIHRLITGFKWKIVDHRNRNTLDNRRMNLRKSNSSQNHANVTDVKTGKIKGCTYVERVNKWCAKITFKGKCQYIGYYQTQDEATKAYQKVHSKLFKDFSPYRMS